MLSFNALAAALCGTNTLLMREINHKWGGIRTNHISKIAPFSLSLLGHNSLGLRPAACYFLLPACYVTADC